MTIVFIWLGIACCLSEDKPRLTPELKRHGYRIGDPLLAFRGYKHKSPKVDEKIKVLKKQVLDLLNEYDEFRKQFKFREYGFGALGPEQARKWLRKVELLRDRASSDKRIPITLRSYPGHLVTMGLSFGDENEHYRILSFEIRWNCGDTSDEIVVKPQEPKTDATPMITAQKEAQLIKEVEPTLAWKNNTYKLIWRVGKFSAVCRCVGFENGKVQLEKEDGKIVEIELLKLSEESRNQFKELQADGAFDPSRFMP